MRVAMFSIACLFGASAHAQFDAEISALSRVESSGGMNTRHPMMKTGMHAGTAAGGFWGVMPLTAKDVIASNQAEFRQYIGYAFMTNSDLTEALNRDRAFDRKIALFMWAKLRQSMSKEQAACAWFRGPYSRACQDPYALASDPYVAKFGRYLEEVTTLEYAAHK
jgi:hypothetical protein